MYWLIPIYARKNSKGRGIVKTNFFIINPFAPLCGMKCDNARTLRLFYPKM